MTQRLESLRSLLAHELKDLYSLVAQRAKMLPPMAAAAVDPRLLGVLDRQRRAADEQSRRLERVLRRLDLEFEGHACREMERLLESLVLEARELVDGDEDPRRRDAGLLAAAQRAAHYEIAGFRTAEAFATRLGELEVAELLRAGLREEWMMHEGLADLRRPPRPAARRSSPRLRLAPRPL